MVCPICETPVSEDADECPECGLEGALIDEEKVAGEDSFDEEVDEETDKDELDTLIDDIEDVVDNAGEPDLEEELAAGEGDEAGEKELEDELLHDIEDLEGEIDEEMIDEEEPIEEEESQYFECPVCENDVEEDALECPNCGALFEEEETGEVTEVKKPGLEEETPSKGAVEKEGSMEEREEKEEFEEVVSEARSQLSEMRDKPVSVDILKQLVHESSSAGKGGDYEEAINIGLEAIERAEDIKDVLKMIKKAKKELTTFKEKGSPYKYQMNELKKAEDKVDQGSIEEAADTVEKVLASVREREDEKTEEEEKSERINSIVSELHNILDTAKQIDLPLKDEKEQISSALEASKEGQVDEALHLLESIKDSSSNKLDDQISEDIKDLRNQISGSEREKWEDHKKLLKKAESAKEKGSYSRVIQFLDQFKDSMQEEGVEKPRKELQYVERLLEYAEKIETDIEEPERYLDKAREEIKSSNLDQAKRSLEMAKENLSKKIPPKLQQAMKEGLHKIETARDEGKRVSKAITHIKQANQLVKKRDYLEALYHIGIFDESIDTILGEESEEKEQPED